MNILKKIIARLTGLELPSFGPTPIDPLEDPRIKLWTRGKIKQITARDKFRQEQERERLAAMERKAIQERRKDVEERNRGGDLLN